MSYKKLSEVSIDHLIEKKGKQDYLSWANAWNEVKKDMSGRNTYSVRG